MLNRHHPLLAVASGADGMGQPGAATRPADPAESEPECIVKATFRDSWRLRLMIRLFNLIYIGRDAEVRLVKD